MAGLDPRAELLIRGLVARILGTWLSVAAVGLAGLATYLYLDLKSAAAESARTTAQQTFADLNVLDQIIEAKARAITLEATVRDVEKRAREVEGAADQVQQTFARVGTAAEFAVKLDSAVATLAEDASFQNVVAGRVRSALSTGNFRISETTARSEAGKDGTWRSPVFCPRGHFACGVNVLLEEAGAAYEDDTAVNAVELICCAF